MKYCRCSVLVILILVTLSCQEEQSNDRIKAQLKKEINLRKSSLRENLRHKVLSYVGENISVEMVDSVFAKIEYETSLEYINSSIKHVATLLELELDRINEWDDIELSILFNELLILDALKERTEVSTVFNSLKAIAYAKRVTESEIEVNIGLIAYDEFFDPEIELISKTDTFNIAVNDDGFGFYTINKDKSINDIVLRGDVIVYSPDGVEKRLPFEFKTNGN